MRERRRSWQGDAREEDGWPGARERTKGEKEAWRHRKGSGREAGMREWG